MVHAPARPARDLPPVTVNLYSDTQTRPTAAMKAARSLVSDGVLNESEYEVMKRRILKFGK
ncbi:MAG: hypothetical protein J0H91_11640 [Rhodospirillales bacterium]|nr:hypothetical protein [Rhodospirillales bacterium]